MISTRRIASVVLAGLILSGTAFQVATRVPEGVRLQAAGQTAGGPTVGTTYKNIQVFTDLKDHPSNDLWDAMQFIAGSLSVRCDYCHVSQTGPFDSDVKPTKRTARNMIRMVRDINNTSFGGREVVTCYTCHRGSPHPNGTPVPWYKTPEEIAAYAAAVKGLDPTNTASASQPTSAEGTAALPDVDQVMAAYRKAVGATGVKSIRVSGVNEIALGATVPFEFEALLPGRASVNTQGGAVRLILNGDRAFRVTAQGTSQLPAAFLRKSSVELMLPVKYETSDVPRQVTGIEAIGGRRYYVVESRPAGFVERLYFDTQSGLLHKLRDETSTALGTKVEERVFEDYRTVNGVTLSYLITSHYMEQQALFRISAIQTNVDLDPAGFEPPPAKKSIDVDPNVLDAYVGTYQPQASGLPPVTVGRESGRLFLSLVPGQKTELLAETETRFFLKSSEDTQVTFFKDDKGQVTRLVFHAQNQPDREMTKVT